MNSEGVKFVRDIMKTERLDALLFFGLPSIRYLCGFTGTDGVLLVMESESTFLTDSRYKRQAEEQVAADLIFCYKNKFSALVDEILAKRHSRVGFDADNLTVAAFDELTKLSSGKFDWCSLSEQLRPLRASKAVAELSALKRAAQLNRAAFEEVLPQIQPGVTERSIALELEFALKRLGGECNAFDFIVASGQRGAYPHGVASEKVLKSGELVTIDFGTRVDGYYSDETVTLALGPVNGKLRQIFDIVLKAHDLALAATKPGMKIRELDAVARNYISKHGYGDCFGHGLGHGVGLEVHEYPAVSARTDALIAERMVITIEPGIYIPGTGGVRIEDTVVVTAEGYEALTSIPKQFYQIEVA